MNNIQKKAIDAVRFLGVDAINKAKSGHPGIVLGAAPMAYTLFSRHLNIDPSNAKWANRDRFILSAGHGSAMLYALNHLAGYNISIDDLKNFRQIGNTAGHPEYGHTDGVEATTGPLGQGLSTAVGMALGESFLAAKYNKQDFPVIDHYTYVLCGDGDLQEGVTLEAASFAGHLKLGKLIVLFDSNDIQLDGEVSMANSECHKMKFEGMNWQYIRVEDGNDVEAIDKAIAEAKSNVDRPTLIEIKTQIGYGSPIAGDSESHGAPLGEAHTAALRESLDWEYEPFNVPHEVYDHYKKMISDRGQSNHDTWVKLFDDYTDVYPDFAEELSSILNDDFITDLSGLPTFEVGHVDATRNVSGKIIAELSKLYPNLIGGSADLTKSTKAKGADGHFTATNRTARNINFGVREHAMGAVVNGLVLHGGLKAFGGAFFVFSDYMKPAVRMAAIMEIPSIFVFSHDTIAVGEDGPTHQPIEQLTGLRAIPNLNTIRPADANETVHSWKVAMQSSKTPTAIVLTRQNVPTLENTKENGVIKGGYVVSPEKAKLDGILIAAGSEVALAIEVQKLLLENGKDVRVVSMPSMFNFEQQSKDYQEMVIPKSVEKRVAIEMGSTLGWYKYANYVYGIDTFGVSAPLKSALEHFGFTPSKVLAFVQSIL